ncbi:MAG: hypothetical protein GTO22_07235 [Gemmatimonadales bacterium]|nr:hypothetical protein [Gemmatimonadales bacterium]
MEDRVAATLSWLRSLDPNLTVSQHAELGYVFLELSPPPQAEYAFRLCFYEGELTLAAVPTCDREAEAFWHQGVERMGAGSLDEAEQAFREFVLDVISHESRITQRRGLLFHRFTCEVHRAAGWQRVGGRILALRTQFRAPPVSGRKREYRSPAVVHVT